MALVLVVDDERVMRATLRTLLEGEGFAVRTVRNGRDALSAIAEKRPDLVLLDVMMPGQNGFAVCAEIRQGDPLLPVLFLTAKTDEVDHVRGLALGADDYIDKTTGDAEIVARVRRALERTQAWRESVGAPPAIRVGRAQVELASCRVLENDAEIARLTPTEAGLLRALDARRGQTVSAEELVEAVRGVGCRAEMTTVRSQMSRLKEKLGAAGTTIVTDWGAGYRLLR